MKYAVQTATEPPECIATYDDGASAAEHAKRINEEHRARGSSYRVRVVRVEADSAAPDAATEPLVWATGWLWPVCFYTPAESYAYGRPDYGARQTYIPASGVRWRDRERCACYFGRGRAVPWIEETWWMQSDYWALHYPRPSKKDPSKIVFTPSEEWGQADRQLRMRPGKYLARYFSDVLTPEQIRTYVAKWDAAFAPRVLQFARTADEIEHVYVNGPRSCMAYDASDFSSHCHPARVYADGDLQLAYITGADGDDIVGRALVWPDKMVHGRVYGDIERMEHALESAGYTPGSLVGARIGKIEDPGGGYVMPYLDHGGYVEDDWNYFVISDHGIPADNTNGLAGAGPVCDNCGDRDPDEYGGRSPDDDWLCESCYSEHVGHCEDCGGVCWRHDMFYGPDDVGRCSYCHGEAVWTCEDCGDAAMRDEMYVGPGGWHRCEDCHDAAVGVCEDCGDETLRDELDENNKCGDCREPDENENENEDENASEPAPAPVWERQERIAPAPEYLPDPEPAPDPNSEAAEVLFGTPQFDAWVAQVQSRAQARRGVAS